MLIHIDLLQYKKIAKIIWIYLRIRDLNFNWIDLLPRIDTRGYYLPSLRD